MADNGSRGDPSHPMLTVFQDIGKIQKGIENLEGGLENLEGGQEEVNNKVSGLHQQMANLVGKEDCKDHRQVLCKKFDAKLEAVAVEASVEDASGAFLAQPSLLEWAQPSLLEWLGKKAGAIAAILGLLVMLGGGVWALSRFIGSVEALMTTQRQEQKAQTKQVLQQLQKPQLPIIVPQPIYIYPDAGSRRRPRRRPRRPRTRPR